MSRIGKMPVPVPSEVEVSVSGQDVTVKGPKGTLERTFPDRVGLSVEGEQVTVSRDDDSREARLSTVCPGHCSPTW